MPVSMKPMPSVTMPKEKSSYVGTMPAMKPMTASVTHPMTKMWTMMMPSLILELQSVISFSTGMGMSLFDTLTHYYVIKATLIVVNKALYHDA
ncbi:hypothetical protein NL676_022462 [Syzygium grande]|nr:hypothetical protein NL676_022462 [Syzygium grande]